MVGRPGLPSPASVSQNNVAEHSGLIGPLKAYIAQGRPFLGVCMGLQALFDSSEEGGGQECLGVFAGSVKLFPTGEDRKVPHMGWNTVEWVREHPITACARRR